MTNSRVPVRKRLTFNVLDMCAISHNNYGLWRHPANRKPHYCDIAYWLDHARAAERAMFDCVFFADLIGVAAGYGGNNDASLREAMHVPILDPAMIISAMAAATTKVGFGLTVSTTYENPFAHARRFSTLDHMTSGRIAWNIVTSYLPNANENFGVRPDQYTHDQRYDLADEFLEVCYKLWEGSWQDGAVIRDRLNQIYADPRKVHPIDHKGRYFSCAGPHICEPSQQRTPVIFQAGSSARGQTFAATHAEVIFVGGRYKGAVKANVAGMRAAVAAAGRSPGDVRIICDTGFILGRTDAEAQAKLDSYQAMTSPHGYLAHHFGAGVDLTKFNRSTTQEEIFHQDGPGAGRMSRYPYPAGTTVGQILDWASQLDNGERFVAVGCPARVADQVEEWVEEIGLDGFLCRQYLADETIRDIGDFLIPELQRRGLWGEAEGSTLRERMFGRDRLLPANHPASAYRDVFRTDHAPGPEVVQRAMVTDGA
jgi:FMN-dependent oxidoreductase (nitrilotriacetate monooxygenase family)